MVVSPAPAADIARVVPVSVSHPLVIDSSPVDCTPVRLRLVRDIGWTIEQAGQRQFVREILKSQRIPLSIFGRPSSASQDNLFEIVEAADRVRFLIGQIQGHERPRHDFRSEEQARPDKVEHSHCIKPAFLPILGQQSWIHLALPHRARRVHSQRHYGRTNEQFKHPLQPSTGKVRSGQRLLASAPPCGTESKRARDAICKGLSGGWCLRQLICVTR